MSDVIVREVDSVSESKFFKQEEQKIFLTQHEKEKGENKKSWMSMDETIAVCCNIIEEIIKITERFRFKSSKKINQNFRIIQSI
jgi:hypothetical protein